VSTAEELLGGPAYVTFTSSLFKSLPPSLILVTTGSTKTPSHRITGTLPAVARSLAG